MPSVDTKRYNSDQEKFNRMSPKVEKCLTINCFFNMM
jgi:hypothetical protein